MIFPPTVVPLAQLRLKKHHGKLSTAQVASKLSNTTMFMRSQYRHAVTVDLKVHHDNEWKSYYLKCHWSSARRNFLSSFTRALPMPWANVFYPCRYVISLECHSTDVSFCHFSNILLWHGVHSLHIFTYRWKHRPAQSYRVFIYSTKIMELLQGGERCSGEPITHYLSMAMRPPYHLYRLHTWFILDGGLFYIETLAEIIRSIR